MRMGKTATEIFRKIAIQNKVDVETAVSEMEAAIDAALANPQTKGMMEAVPHAGEKPTPEEVVLYVASKVETP